MLDASVDLPPPGASCCCCRCCSTAQAQQGGGGQRRLRRRRPQWRRHGSTTTLLLPTLALVSAVLLALLQGATPALAFAPLAPSWPPRWAPLPGLRGLRMQAAGSGGSGGGPADKKGGSSTSTSSSSGGSGLLNRPKVPPRAAPAPSSLFPLRRPPQPATPSPPPVAEHFHDSILDADVGAMLQQQLARLRGNGNARNATEPEPWSGKEEEGKGARWGGGATWWAL